jgi:hypothetical protein
VCGKGRRLLEEIQNAKTIIMFNRFGCIDNVSSSYPNVVMLLRGFLTLALFVKMFESGERSASGSALYAYFPPRTCRVHVNKVDSYVKFDHKIKGGLIPSPYQGKLEMCSKSHQRKRYRNVKTEPGPKLMACTGSNLPFVLFMPQ